MKLVLQIAGGLMLAGAIATVATVACVALFAKGVSDAVKEVRATQTAVEANFRRLAAVTPQPAAANTAITGEGAPCSFGGPGFDVCCPPTLRNPAIAATDVIESCAHWYGNLPTTPPRPAVDGKVVVAELCRRGQRIPFVAVNFGLPATCD